MSLSITVLLIIIGVTLVLFVKEWVPIDVTAIFVMVSEIPKPEAGVRKLSNSDTIHMSVMVIICESHNDIGFVKELGD